MNIEHRGLALLLIFALESAIGWAQQRVPLPPAPEIRVNSVSGSSAGTHPVLVPADQGATLLIWEDVREAVGLRAHNIYASRLVYPIAADRNIPLTHAEGSATQPDAAPLPGGTHFALSWQDALPTLRNGSILCRLHSVTDGFHPGQTIIVSRDTAGNPIRPRIAVVDSSMAFVWQQTAERSNAMLRLYRIVLSGDSMPKPVTDTIRQNAPSAQQALQPAVTLLPNGTIIGSWIEKGESKRYITMRRFDADGSARGLPVTVSDFRGDRLVTPPELCPLPNGDSWCVWADARSGDWRVYAQRIDQEGAPIGADQVISGSMTALALSPVSIAGRSDGVALIAWEIMYDGHVCIAGQWIRPDGELIGGNVLCIDPGKYESKAPFVGFIRDTAYMAWCDNRACDTPDQFDVFLKRIDPPDLPSSVDPPAHASSPVRCGNYPNPFSGRTTIRFRVGDDERGFHCLSAAGQRWTIKVYDMLGREIADVTPGLRRSEHSFMEVDVDASLFAAGGIYLYSIRRGNEHAQQCMTVLR